jgi:hypothetical protein
MTVPRTRWHGFVDNRQRLNGAGLRLAVLITFALVACTPAETGKIPVPLTPPQERATAPVVREVRPTPPGTVPGSTDLATPLVVSVPPEAIYVCVTQSNDKQQQVVIEFEPKVRELCRKHPEMGPCQYERDICRRSGGRVFAKDGKEITLATEAEYDKRVMRVRFKAN